MHAPHEMSGICEIDPASDSIVMLKSRFSPPMPIRRPITVVRTGQIRIKERFMPD